MKKSLLILLCLCCSHAAFGWGQKGHDVVAYIAESHLTPEAAAKIEKLLEGHSPVYYSSWLDTASHTPEYDYTRTWHYLNIDEGKTIETMSRNPAGDVLSAVTEITAKLKAGGLSPEEEALNLKMLIHLVGDMHCPMHLGRKSDVGGNRYTVQMFRSPTSLHSIWDSSILEAGHKWSYTEWKQQIDFLDEDDAELIAGGDPKEWARETHAVCIQVYKETPEGSEISFDYVAKFTPVIEQQLLRGGHRLARLLNDIYQ